MKQRGTSLQASYFWNTKKIKLQILEKVDDLEYIDTAMRAPSSIQPSSASSMWPDWLVLQYIALDLLVDCQEPSRMTLQNSLKMLSALHQRALPTQHFKIKPTDKPIKIDNKSRTEKIW